jgi:transposase InsO family protein
VRHRLIQPKPRKRRRDDYKRWESSRSMELWQFDVMGSVFLTNGIGVSVVTGIDDHSRFCVIAKVIARATARQICDTLVEALGTHGIPEQILTLNGRSSPAGSPQARQRAARPHLSQQRHPLSGIIPRVVWGVGALIVLLLFYLQALRISRLRFL